MEQPKIHEIVRPVREIVSHLGQWVLDKILPTEIFDDFIQGVQQESTERTVQTYGFNPRGEYTGSPVPDVAGKDL